MFYLLDEEKLIPGSLDEGADLSSNQALCIIGFEELQALSERLGIRPRIVNECLRYDISKHESHEGFDFITLNIPSDADPKKTPQRICIYLTSKLLVFICSEQNILLNIMEEIESEHIKINSSGKVLHLFFDRLTFDDPLEIEKIEQEITNIEDKLISSNKPFLIGSITAYRKKLLSLKRYYEQLVEISEAIEQNENGLIDKRVLRYFRIITNRANRLYNNVLNLRDYVTQVREAYQAQIDINLNIVMKFFTVITSIFLPLTLIVGWYGMNLKMPEFGWDFGYLFVIGISLVTITFTLVYFKKKKWF